jgi:hypothetical protein
MRSRGEIQEMFKEFYIATILISLRFCSEVGEIKNPPFVVLDEDYEGEIIDAIGELEGRLNELIRGREIKEHCLQRFFNYRRGEKIKVKVFRKVLSEISENSISPIFLIKGREVKEKALMGLSETLPPSSLFIIEVKGNNYLPVGILENAVILLRENN